MNHVDPNGNREVLYHFRRCDGLRCHGFGLYVISDVVRQIPHVFHYESVHPTLHQRLSIAQSVFDDHWHPVAGVTGRTGKRPKMDHADHRLRRWKKICERPQSRPIHLLFPWGHLTPLGLGRHLESPLIPRPRRRRASTRNRTASHGGSIRRTRRKAAMSRALGKFSPAPTTDAARAPPAFAASAPSAADHPRSRACRNPARKASPAPVESTVRTWNEGTATGAPSLAIMQPCFPSFSTTSQAPALRRRANASEGLRVPTSAVASSKLRRRISTLRLICKIFRGIALLGSIPTSSETQPPRAWIAFSNCFAAFSGPGFRKL